jgi:hypothetical protein
MIGGLLNEFWPDIRRMIARKHEETAAQAHR